MRRIGMLCAVLVLVATVGLGAIGQTTSAAPVLKAPLDGSEVTSPILFTWQPVNGAVQYQINIRGDNHIGKDGGYLWATVEDAQYTADLSFITAFPPDNTYYWGVRAIDKAGNTSAWSSTYSFVWDKSNASGEPATVDYSGANFTIKDKNGDVLGHGSVATDSSPYWPSNDYRIVKYAIGDVNGDGKKEVVLIARHNKWYPAEVYVVNADGLEVSRYWNPGWIHDVILNDINGDGVPEILFEAINNDNGMTQAVCALNARTMKGEAPPRYGTIGTGTEIWYAFLPSGTGFQSMAISGNDLVVTGNTGTQYRFRLSDGKHLGNGTNSAGE